MSGSPMNLLAIGLAAAMAGGCEIHAQSFGVDGSFERTLRIDGPVDLDVLSRSGHIHVQVGSSNTVQVSARIRAYGSLTLLNSYSPQDQVSKLESAPPVEQTGSKITIGDIADDALASNVTIDYDLTVPANTRLRTSSRSGDQIIDAIYGPVTASSRSGRIHVGKVTRELDIDTRSGDIELLDQTSDVRVVSRSGNVALEGQPARAWTIETRSGDVDVRLPANGGAEVVLDSHSGSVESRRPVEMHGAKSRRRVQGIIGGGGGRVEVSTRSGSVEIR